MVRGSVRDWREGICGRGEGRFRGSEREVCERV